MTALMRPIDIKLSGIIQTHISRKRFSSSQAFTSAGWDFFVSLTEPPIF